MVEVVSDDQDDTAMKTLAFMEAGEQTIYRPVLQHGHWIARPDVLERVEGGVDVRRVLLRSVRHQTVKASERRVLLSRLLLRRVAAHCAGQKPVQGYVMHSGDGTVEGYMLDDYATRYQLTLDAIERILDGEDAPHF